MGSESTNGKRCALMFLRVAVTKAQFCQWIRAQLSDHLTGKTGQFATGVHCNGAALASVTLHCNSPLRLVSVSGFTRQNLYLWQFSWHPEWWEDFRYSVQCWEPISFAVATDFSAESVKQHHDKVSEVQLPLKQIFGASTTYVIDETCMTTVLTSTKLHLEMWIERIGTTGTNNCCSDG